MFGFLAALFVAIVVAWNVYQSISWQESDPVYQTLLFVRDYFPAFLTGAVLLGWTWITYRFIARPLRYLDLVTSAAEQLAHPDESPIVLPDALADTEYELNLVREPTISKRRLPASSAICRFCRMNPKFPRSSGRNTPASHGARRYAWRI